MSAMSMSAALIAAQKEMPQLHRDAKADVQTKGGGSFSYAYLTLESLLAATIPVLNRHGLALVQMPCQDEGRLALRTEIRHESGDAISTTFPLAVPGDAPAQAVGSAITYARRYSLMAMLGLSADEDDDGAQAQTQRTQAVADGPSEAQHGKLGALLRELEEKQPKAEGQQPYTEDARSYIKAKFGKHSRTQLSKSEMSDLIDEVQGWVDALDIPFGEPAATAV